MRPGEPLAAGALPEGLREPAGGARVPVEGARGMSLSELSELSVDDALDVLDEALEDEVLDESLEPGGEGVEVVPVPDANGVSGAVLVDDVTLMVVEEGGPPFVGAVPLGMASEKVTEAARRRRGELGERRMLRVARVRREVA